VHFERCDLIGGLDKHCFVGRQLQEGAPVQPAGQHCGALPTVPEAHRRDRQVRDRQERRKGLQQFESAGGRVDFQLLKPN
jgi:hypothetical protein